MQTHRLEVVRGGTGFSLPCPCLSGRKCSIYQSRFTICRDFQCRLLRELNNGTCSLDEAVRVVQLASSLRTAVRSALLAAGCDAAGALPAAYERWRELRPEQAGGPVEVVFGALRALIANRFLLRKAGDVENAAEGATRVDR